MNSDKIFIYFYKPNSVPSVFPIKGKIFTYQIVRRSIKIMSLMFMSVTKMMNNDMIMMAALMFKVLNEKRSTEVLVVSVIHGDDPQEDQHHDLKPDRYSFL